MTTERLITVREGVLHYVKYMATTTTETPMRTKHLEARLTRIGDV